MEHAHRGGRLSFRPAFIAWLPAIAVAAGCGAEANVAENPWGSEPVEEQGSSERTSELGQTRDSLRIMAKGKIVPLIEAAKLARYRVALPQLAWAELGRIFDAPTTLWFDEEVMVPSYQDSVGDGSVAPIGARANSQGARIIVPQGRRLFSADGRTFSFPFAHTAGTDRSTNVFVLDFMFLPVDDAGNVLPVVYRKIDDPRGLGGLGVHKWTWLFPRGTMMGELIFLRDSSGELSPVEVRTRTRYAEAWAVNAFRPFPTASSLARAIKEARPDWASRTNLSRVVHHLESPATLTAKSLDSPAWKNVFTAAGHVDEIPPIEDESLVRELLRKTPFVSAYATPWKVNGRAVTYAATTRERFSVVPDNYDAGLLEVREASCMRCHSEAGRAINDFEPAAVLYGDVWGEDGIFSFHPYDATRYVEFNRENRRVRPEFEAAGLVVPYDPQIHPSSVYKALAR